MEEQRIPKIIHYAWFGRGEKSQLAKECIESWSKYLPDYEIKEWNEDNFDLEQYEYAKSAYENRKFAYVADVVRLHALYYEGGIYMDTDVEVKKNMDPLLIHHGFSGFESENGIPTGTMAAEANNQWIKEQLDFYDTAVFNIEDVNKLLTNVEIITSISLEKHNLKLNNTLQELKYGMMMYPVDFFCAKSVSTGELLVTNNTYTVHHFAGSWVPAKARRNKTIMRMINRVLGEKIASRIYNFISKKRK